MDRHVFVCEHPCPQMDVTTANPQATKTKLRTTFIFIDIHYPINFHHSSTDKSVAMNKSWSSQIETWNLQVRAGEGHSVGRALSHIPRGEIPIEHLAKIANLAWRINRPSLGIRLLYPELRRHNGLKVNAHPDAFAEYAACLIEIGALSEAKRTLSTIPGNTSRSKFYSALLLFKEWDYEGAAKLLEDYLPSLPSDYHQLVCRVNLASAYVNIKEFAKAQACLRELRAELTTRQHWLLFGNCCEIESQIHFHQQNHTEALTWLAQSEKALAGSRNMGWLYTKKWQLINSLYQFDQNVRDHMLSDFMELKETARRMHSWETLRELDLHWALRTHDEPLANHVFFGSPLRRYRENILAIAAGDETPGSQLQIHEGYLWAPNPENSPTVNIVDAGHFVMDFANRPNSFLLKKLFITLLSDFYAPFRVGQLFSALFPNEYFDCDSSPDRVFQIVRRLRLSLKNESPGIDIQSINEGYSLLLGPGQGVQITKTMVTERVESKFEVFDLFIKEHFATAEFSASDLSQRLGCSTRSANRILSKLSDRGDVSVAGRGKWTRYKRVS